MHAKISTLVFQISPPIWVKFYKGVVNLVQLVIGEFRKE
jgi:hypothetical protein